MFHTFSVPSVFIFKEEIGMTDNELMLQNNLATIRKNQKLSQAELAKVVGTSRTTISNIENGRFNPNAKLELNLCIALDNLKKTHVQRM